MDSSLFLFYDERINFQKKNICNKFQLSSTKILQKIKIEYVSIEWNVICNLSYVSKTRQRQILM